MIPSPPVNLLLRPASWWVLLNVAGIALYLFLASTLWVRPGEEGVPGGPGDAFYWLVCLAPVLAVFFVLDAAALPFAVRRTWVTGRRGALVLWLGVALLWVGALAFDQHRSYRRIEQSSTSPP